ncbi:MAG: hypothetical protein ACQEQ7_05605 [Thermodesulfobacteriota bacterium]
MPLAFESTSHGTIAFGFFNIDSDMLLLDRLFFFSTDFCLHVEKLADLHTPNSFATGWTGYAISDAEQIGDLMGAIHGVRHTGFIGEVYQRFPFPKREADFKQKPEGDQTQAVMTSIIQNYGTPAEIPLVFNPEPPRMAIGPYEFTLAQFGALIHYVWEGGYPKWREASRPVYVIRMKTRVEKSPLNLFADLF